MKCSTGLTFLHLSWLKRPGGGQKSVQGGISLQTALPEYCAHFELGFGQPVICTKYPSVDQCYGVFSTFGSQISGRIMLPMSMSTEDVPIYVNAKQYHGIIRRRKSRAKAAMENKLPRNRKPYMHRSRHLHAMRRPRDAKKAGDFQLSQPTGSQNSEVLESGGATLNSSMEANCGGSNLSGSEVTRMDGGHGIAMPSSRWTSQFGCKGKSFLAPVRCGISAIPYNLAVMGWLEVLKP
ncbi:hypothetical protein OIU77_030952 [Salix suchowensis]|uniref:Nuclear transcription factor Y subunit n=1 Tax=Salix suchowensis TaxID=1278906 RepID=A0ABQ9BE66_9ROSI|nr:hypothetical protein OIU77_030952 [Salix suchowensis]